MRGRSMRFGAVLALILVSAARLWSFQWPVGHKVLTATFGESRWNHYHTGIDIGGGAQIVRPVEDGEVIYFYDGWRRTRTPPSGLGSFVVIEHERGIRSLYAHLEPGSVSALPERVSAEEPVGIIGESGASLGKHLHLELIDSEIGSYVNPLLVLPSLRDTVTPEIRGVRYLPSGSEPSMTPIVLTRGMTVPSGDHRLLVELFDISEYVAYYCPMAPYRTTGFFNGSEVFDFTFDSLAERNGTLVLGTGGDAIAFDELYHDDWIIDAGVVPFRVGEIQIEIVARDVAGNEASYRIPISVK